MGCKKCGKNENLMDVKIKNEDFGPLCGHCYSAFQDKLVETFRQFVATK